MYKNYYEVYIIIVPLLCSSQIKATLPSIVRQLVEKQSATIVCSSTMLTPASLAHTERMPLTWLEDMAILKSSAKPVSK